MGTFTRYYNENIEEAKENGWEKNYFHSELNAEEERQLGALKSLVGDVNEEGARFEWSVSEIPNEKRLFMLFVVDKGLQTSTSLYLQLDTMFYQNDKFGGNASHRQCGFRIANMTVSEDQLHDLEATEPYVVFERNSLKETLVLGVDKFKDNIAHHLTNENNYEHASAPKSDPAS